MIEKVLASSEVLDASFRKGTKYVFFNLIEGICRCHRDLGENREYYILYRLPSIIWSRVIYRPRLRRSSNHLLQLPHLNALNPLVHCLLTPQQNRKMTKRSHSNIHPPPRSDPSLFPIAIPSHPSLIQDNLSILHIL